MSIFPLKLLERPAALLGLFAFPFLFVRLRQPLVVGVFLRPRRLPFRQLGFAPLRRLNEGFGLPLVVREFGLGLLAPLAFDVRRPVVAVEALVGGKFPLGLRESFGLGLVDLLRRLVRFALRFNGDDGLLVLGVHMAGPSAPPCRWPP